MSNLLNEQPNAPAFSETERNEAWALAYLLTGEESAASDALQEALAGAQSGEALQERVIRAALQHAEHLPADRFFLRALAHPPLESDPGAKLGYRLDRLPVPDRAAFILQIVAGLSESQIASILHLETSAVADGLRNGWDRLLEVVDLGQVSPDGAPGSREAHLRKGVLALTPPPVPEYVTPGSPKATQDPSHLNPVRRPSPFLLVGGAALVLLVLLLQLPGLRGRMTSRVADGTQVVQLTPGAPRPESPKPVSPPAFSFDDLRQLDRGKIVEFSTNGTAATTWPMTNDRLPVALKLVQWLGEAEEASQESSPPSTMHTYVEGQVSDQPLFLRFENGWIMRLELGPACRQSPDCAVQLTVQGNPPVRLHQTDLVRYLAGALWLRELKGDRTPSVLPSNWVGDLHLTLDQVTLLAREGASKTMQVQSIYPMARLALNQDLVGRWRTKVVPVWLVSLTSSDPAKVGGGELIMDDATGQIVLRVEGFEIR